MSVGLFAAAVVVRLAALAILGLHPQTYEYEVQAHSLLAGEGYRYVRYGTPHLALGPPLFPFLCAGLYRVFGDSSLSVILLQIVASALIPVVIVRVAREVGVARRLQWVAALPAVVHPGLVVYAVGKLHPLSLDALLLSLVLLSVLRLAPAAGLAAYAWAGGLLGLSALSRATVTMFALPAILWIVWVAPARERRRVALGITVFLATAALVVLPWTVRNYVVLHRLVLFTTDTGELFWRGNNPIATGSALLPNGRSIFHSTPEAFQKAIQARDELGQADLFRETALAFIRGHPKEFVALLFRKWVSFWWFPATAGVEYPMLWLRIYRVFYVALLAGALLGGLVAWRGGHRGVRERLVLLAAMLASISVAQSLYYVDVRHRWGVEPLLGIFAAAAVGSLAAGLKRTRSTCP